MGWLASCSAVIWEAIPAVLRPWRVCFREARVWGRSRVTWGCLTKMKTMIHLSAAQWLKFWAWRVSGGQRTRFGIFFFSGYSFLKQWESRGPHRSCITQLCSDIPFIQCNQCLFLFLSEQINITFYFWGFRIMFTCFMSHHFCVANQC